MPTPPSAIKVVANKAQFDAAVKNTAIKTIKLGDNITGDITVNRLVNIDFNSKKITGDVTITTGQTGALTLIGGGTSEIIGNLTVTAANATITNTVLVTSGIVTINNVAIGTWNENVSGNTLLVNDPDGLTLVVDANQTVALLTVSSTAGSADGAGAVTITNNGIITNVAANAEIALVNNGTVAEVSGTAPVAFTGTGTVEAVTNSNPVVNTDKQDSFLSEVGELTSTSTGYAASFKWGSTNGIGLGEKSAHTSPGGYNYYGNGAYLDITIDKDDAKSDFDSVLSSLTLKTGDGNVDEISGTATGRQAADWGKVNANHSGTKLKEEGTNAVFYGVRQNNTNGVATVGFNAGEKRDVNLTFVPKADLAPGTYTITVQPKHQTSETSGTNLGAPITYTFTVENTPQ